MRDGTENAAGERKIQRPQHTRTANTAFALHNNVPRDRPSSVTPDGVPPPDLRCPAHAARPYDRLHSLDCCAACGLSFPATGSGSSQAPPEGEGRASRGGVAEAIG